MFGWGCLKSGLWVRCCCVLMGSLLSVRRCGSEWECVCEFGGMRKRKEKKKERERERETRGAENEKKSQLKKCESHLSLTLALPWEQSVRFMMDEPLAPIPHPSSCIARYCIAWTASTSVDGDGMQHPVGTRSIASCAVAFFVFNFCFGTPIGPASVSRKKKKKD
ncbi:MAG: hypothetical protein BYD32DRAFT_205046 [Podila humilis]|nr:MAG: hypothetical protein BYD32DRAFT_205046 [Podila humilis]